MEISLFGLTFNLYGLVLGIGILASLQASLWLAKERKIETRIIEGLFWWAVGGGIIGARLYHVIDKWNEIYSLDPQSILYLWNGGLGIYGAIIGGVVGLWLGAKRLRIKFDRGLLDVALFGLPLGQAIGRWGNYFNNEIVGKNGEPLFFYESMLDLVLFGVLVWFAKRHNAGSEPAGGGKIAGVYLIGYGLIRFSLEQLRPENIIWKIAGIPTAVLVSVVAVICGVFILRRRS